MIWRGSLFVYGLGKTVNIVLTVWQSGSRYTVVIARIPFIHKSVTEQDYS